MAQSNTRSNWKTYIRTFDNTLFVSRNQEIVAEIWDNQNRKISTTFTTKTEKKNTTKITLQQSNNEGTYEAGNFLRFSLTVAGAAVTASPYGNAPDGST